MLVAVDLFSGGGGLTEGLKQAGFCVSAAAEVDPVACATYAANHPGAIVFNRDICSLSGEELLRSSPTGTVDLIAACPPCQGFSSLTFKYHRDDPRNQLIFEFVRLVREVRPRAIMMENVPGLSKGAGSSLFQRATEDLKEMGYILAHNVLNVADYGVPQARRRLVVLGGLGFPIAIPEATHSRTPASTQKPWKTVREAIAGMPKPITMELASRNGGPSKANWHVTRKISDLNVQRLRATKSGQSRGQLPIELRPDCHKTSDKGFSNVYGRMTWNEPSPTITGGCTTLSKGRFGHPSQLRTISVREAALLQTFPEEYVFATDHMDHVCKIIGNALPPKFAAAMASACTSAIKGNSHDSQ
ncbi:MAG: DNA cytosine methyltransferase [Fluviibacter sp.]